MISCDLFSQNLSNFDWFDLAVLDGAQDAIEKDSELLLLPREKIEKTEYVR